LIITFLIFMIMVMMSTFSIIRKFPSRLIEQLMFLIDNLYLLACILDTLITITLTPTSHLISNFSTLHNIQIILLILRLRNNLNNILSFISLIFRFVLIFLYFYFNYLWFSWLLQLKIQFFLYFLLLFF
jgi:hypothetical protein